MNNKVKIITIFLIIMLFFSTISFAIYRALTIGNKSLTFVLGMTNVSGLPPVVFLVNEPELTSGMIPIKYDGSNWVITNSSDILWYSYTSSFKNWANVMLSDGRYKTDGINIIDTLNSNINVLTDGTQIVALEDLGSMFVWIPRFEYKIEYTDLNNISLGGSIDVNFIETTTTTPTTNYTIHPAFRNGAETNYENGEWNSEIDGFWISKFQASNSTREFVSTTGYIRSVPSVPMWSNVQVSRAFTYCMNMDTEHALTYGFDLNSIDSHLTKNSEWGATAYLAYSEYGRNGIQPNINNYMPTAKPRITFAGHGGTSTTAARVISNPVQHNSTNGLLASTTGNATGVYEMNGGLNEFVAAFIGNNTLIDETLGITYSTDTLYTNKYTTGDMLIHGKNGDATKETYNWDQNNTVVAEKYLFRGGSTSNGGNSGLFSYYNSDGTGGIGGGSPDYRGFRPVLIVTQ